MIKRDPQEIAFKSNLVDDKLTYEPQEKQENSDNKDGAYYQDSESFDNKHQSEVYANKEYMIVRSPSHDTDDLSMLERGVMIWMRAGWKPIGGVTFDKKGYPCQAMVRGL